MSAFNNGKTLGNLIVHMFKKDDRENELKRKETELEAKRQELARVRLNKK